MVAYESDTYKNPLPFLSLMVIYWMLSVFYVKSYELGSSWVEIRLHYLKKQLVAPILQN